MVEFILELRLQFGDDTTAADRSLAVNDITQAARSAAIGGRLVSLSLRGLSVEEQDPEWAAANNRLGNAREERK